LLSLEEKALLERLALFAGGFDLAAVEPVALSSQRCRYSSTGRQVAGCRRSDRPKANSLPMLDTIREYAIEKLQQSGDTDGRRGTPVTSSSVRRATRELSSYEQAHWLKRIDDEQATSVLPWSGV